MATVIFIKESKQTPSVMRGCINYCVQEKKTVDSDGRQYVGGVNCLGMHAYDEFMATKNLYGKASGTYFYQYVQSFMPGEIKSYDEAHRIGLEFAEQSFLGYEVLVATHLDAYDDHGVQRVHNHFLVNSVSFEDGRKIHFTPNTLQELRKISDDICRDHGLSVLPPSERRNGQGIGTREYRATMRGEGWKFGLINDIDTAMTQAGDRREFCDILASVGYSVTWTNERKYITFTCPNGRKIRDNKLHDNKYTKENLEYEFRIRKQITEHAGSQFHGQTESSIQNSSQDNRGNTVSADCLCDSEGGLERLSGVDETGGDLQPTLYQQIAELTTKEESQAYTDEMWNEIRNWVQKVTGKVQKTAESIVPRVQTLLNQNKELLEQDGRMREQFISGLDLKETNRIKEFKDLLTGMKRWIVTMMVSTAIGSAALSAVICLLMR